MFKKFEISMGDMCMFKKCEISVAKMYSMFKKFQISVGGNVYVQEV